MANLPQVTPGRIISRPLTPSSKSIWPASVNRQGQIKSRVEDLLDSNRYAWIAITYPGKTFYIGKTSVNKEFLDLHFPRRFCKKFRVADYSLLATAKDAVGTGQIAVGKYSRKRVVDAAGNLIAYRFDLIDCPKTDEVSKPIDYKLPEVDYASAIKSMCRAKGFIAKLRREPMPFLLWKQIEKEKLSVAQRQWNRRPGVRSRKRYIASLGWRKPVRRGSRLPQRDQSNHGGGEG